MYDSDSSDNISVSDLDNTSADSIPEADLVDSTESAYDAETMDLHDYVMESHVSELETSDAQQDFDEIPDISAFSSDVEHDIEADYDELPSVEPFSFDANTADLPDEDYDKISFGDGELTESQMERLADLDAGYKAVVEDYTDVMTSIQDNAELSTSEKISQLEQLRSMAQESSDEYHAYEQSIIDNPNDDSGYTLKRTR